MKNGGSSSDVLRASGEIDTLRHELGRLVSELDRRRHELLDVRLHVRRHPGVVIAAAGVAALLLGTFVGVAIRKRRRQTRPTIRAREARRAIARMLDHPERIGAEPSVAMRIATAAGVAAGSVVARRFAEQLLSRTIASR